MESSLSRRSSLSTATVEVDGGRASATGQADSFLSLYQKCHEIHATLMCLKYESEFCTEYKCKPIHRYYFCSPSNPSEQFFTFSCLAAWLIKSKNITSLVPVGDRSSVLSTISTLNPQDYVDPNVTITVILDVVRSLSSRDGGHSHGHGKSVMDFAPVKLKQGSGVEVINVLSVLTRAAVEASISKCPPIAVEIHNLSNEVTAETDALASANDDDDDDDDDIEMGVEESHYSLQGDEDEDDEGNLFVDSFTPAAVHSSSSSRPQAEMLISQVDQATWSQEVDRVLPQLKVSLSSDTRSAASSISDKSDWRVRLTQLTGKSGEMNDIFTGTLDLMGRIVKEVKSTQVSLESREKYLSTQFDGLIKEYITIKEQLDKLESVYSAASSGIMEKTKQLTLISDELESIKGDMEERGAKMTDGGPLVSIRKSLATLKSELITMEIRIGVASHSILQYCMKDSIAQMAIKKGDTYTLDETGGLLYNTPATAPYNEIAVSSFLR